MLCVRGITANRIIIWTVNNGSGFGFAVLMARVHCQTNFKQLPNQTSVLHQYITCLA